LLKNKALNLDSAFNLFDKDNKQAISIVDFKEIILFTLKFTTNQNELEDLTTSIFNGKTLLTKLDFYKIFAIHLPHEGPMEDLLKKSEETSLKSKVFNNPNQVIEIDNFSLNIGAGAKQQKLSEIISSESNLKKENIGENKTTSQIDPSFKLSGQINQTQALSQSQTHLTQTSNRSLKEIVGKINDYMMKTGKSSPSELYKMFDRDGDLKVGKDVI
jgi:hypothetical protein